VKSNFNNGNSQTFQFCAHLTSSPTSLIIGIYNFSLLKGVQTTLTESSTCLHIAQTSTTFLNTFILKTTAGNLKIIAVENKADGSVESNGYLLSSEIYAATTYGFSIENGGYGVWGSRGSVEGVELGYTVGYV